MAKLIKTSRFSKSGRALEFKMGVKFSSDTTVHSFFFFQLLYVLIIILHMEESAHTNSSEGTIWWCNTVSSCS